MKYLIDSKIQAPAYQQLYKQIRDDIINGIYLYKTKLPSKRTVAEELNISTVTVEHAYELLCDEGYIEAKERSGYFVIFRTDDGFINTQTESSLLLAEHHSSVSTSFPISVLTKTMRKVINDYGESILETTPNSGSEELRRVLKHYLARSKGIKVEIDQIIIGSGSEYFYTLISELFGRNKKYAIENPSYKKIEQVYSAADIEYEMLPLGKNGIESYSLWDCNADVLHITPYRSFPTGVTADASKRHEYIRWAKNNNDFIVEDDFESEFSITNSSEETLFTLTREDNVIYMNTFSKTISPSLRIGYMILPKSLMDSFNKKLGFFSCTVPAFMQYVLAEIIANGDFERHINRVRRRKRKEQN